MKSALTSSPQKPKVSASSAALNTSDDTRGKSIGPYRTIATNYQPFSSHEKIFVSKMLDSPIKILNSEEKISPSKSAILIKTLREPSQSYSRSQERITVNGSKESKIYVGEHNGKVKEGYGKLYDCNKTLIYEGEWKNDQAHGKGIWYNNEIKSNFSKYIGEFYQGQKNGAGIEYYRDGSIYVGNFKKDCKDGMGQLSKRNGQKYNGIWFMGKLIDQI